VVVFCKQNSFSRFLFVFMLAHLFLFTLCVATLLYGCDSVKSLHGVLQILRASPSVHDPFAQHTHKGRSIHVRRSIFLIILKVPKTAKMFINRY
jgi:hypothetical protein